MGDWRSAQAELIDAGQKAPRHRDARSWSAWIEAASFAQRADADFSAGNWQGARESYVEVELKLSAVKQDLGLLAHANGRRALVEGELTLASLSFASARAAFERAGDLEHAREGTAGMVLMLVREQQAIDALRIDADRAQPQRQLARRQSGVHEQPCRTELDQGRVPV